MGGDGGGLDADLGDRGGLVERALAGWADGQKGGYDAAVRADDVTALGDGDAEAEGVGGDQTALLEREQERVVGAGDVG